jgi:DnaJ domain
MTKKTSEELAVERAAAQEQIDAILSTSRPKNLAEGVGTGIGNIVSGAVGAAGVAVLAPTLGLAIGLRGGGIIGGVVGVAGGAVIGLVGAAALAVGGVVSGVTQIGRGFAAVPESITAPRHGKWWNERQGRWVLTDMSKEKDWIASFPNEEDADILGKVQGDLDASANDGDSGAGAVKDMFYYECLDIPSNAEPAVIKRQYYVLARKYHPDKNPGDNEAAEKFKHIAEAYQVLSDAELRAKYNREGKDGLSADKTSVAATMADSLDPTLLFAFLFGSDQFSSYIGRLSTATSASVGDSPKISIKDASELQKRRVTRLAVVLIGKITPWVQAQPEDDTRSAIEAEWIVDADTLSKTSFGYPLVTTIGKVRVRLLYIDTIVDCIR